MSGCPAHQLPDESDSSACAADEAGWPRPLATFTLERLGEPPSKTKKRVPWISGPKVTEDDDWLTFRDDATRAHHERLCAVCGEHLDGVVILGKTTERETSGPGAHPRCMWLAVNTCPHFQRRSPTPDTVIAYRYDGAGVGYEHDVYGDPNDPEIAALIAEWENSEMYTHGSNPVDESCTPVTYEQLRALAHQDPLGTGITAELDGDTVPA